MAIKQIRYGGSVCDDREYQAVMKSVRESIISGGWQATKQATLMEGDACKQIQTKYGILTNSGSSAGLLALSALELPKGSEVIISACTFPTIFNIILQCGLVPVVVDAKVGSYTFDIDEVENAITEKTGAIIAIHPVGNPVDMPKLMKIIKKYSKKIYVIEDCCDTWLTSIKGKMVGSYGDVSFTSFHAAHIVSMGVGGGVFTSNKEIARNVRMYRDWGRQANTNKPNTYKTLPKDYNPRFIYEKIGYNFQILELQAAMGRVQLRKAEKIKQMRKDNFDYLYKRLSKFKDLTMPFSIRGSDVCWFAFPITTKGDRGELVAHLEKNGIETRSMFAGNVTRHPMCDNIEYKISGKLDGANYIMRQSFWISVHPRLTKNDKEYIIKTFEDYYTKSSKKVCIPSKMG